MSDTTTTITAEVAALPKVMSAELKEVVASAIASHIASVQADAHSVMSAVANDLGGITHRVVHDVEEYPFDAEAEVSCLRNEVYLAIDTHKTMISIVLAVILGLEIANILHMFNVF